MEDQNNKHVKDTTAWTLERIFEILRCSPSSDCPVFVITAEELPHIITVLMTSIRDAPDVSEQVCRAICFLAQRYEDDDDAESEDSSSLLTPYLGDIISALLVTADRMDDTNSGVRLRAAAYEALNEIVRCSKVPETSNTIAPLLLEITNRLNKTIELPSDDREKQNDLLAHLCGVLQVIVQKLSGHDETKSIILQSADRMMDLFFQVFHRRSATVREGAMLAIGSLAYAMGPEFAKHMSVFKKYLVIGLKNLKEYQVCSVSVGVIRDICRALDGNILPFCDVIMVNLIKGLSNPVLHDSVKPHILSRFGDIALAIGEHFEKYMGPVMKILQGAADLCFELDTSDEALLELGHRFRQGIFEAYSGILQGFKSSKARLMLPHAPHILNFAEAVFRDKNRDERVTIAAATVMGDLADIVSPGVKNMFQAYKSRVDWSGNGLEPISPDDPDIGFHDPQWDEVPAWTMIGLRLVYVMKTLLIKL